MTEGASVQVKKAIEASRELPSLARVLYGEIMRTRALTIGAAVAFFLLLALVPLLMVASALLSALPIKNLFQKMLDTMALLVPPDAMSLVRTVLASILTAHPAGILSIGILSYFWAASGSFSSLIEALNIAYDVKLERPWWRDKLQALLLTVVCGGLSVFSFLVVLAGPRFIHYVSYVLPVPYILNLVWPPLRIALIFSSFVTNVMLLYYLGPNRKVTFRSALPGAALAVGIWFLGSLGLDLYIGHFANYNATYGSLGAIIILMFWLYLTSVSILVGAELNAELWKRAHPGLVDPQIAQAAALTKSPRIAAQTPGAA